ncbi:MAG: class I SAM-dependent methyltransferase [Alphaproteobacteria bacterium]
MSHSRIPRARVDRVDFLLDCCREREVLHLGCADHPYTRERLADGSWLHRALSEVAARCFGIDANAEVVRWLREDRGIANLAVGDAEALDALDAGRFDVVVAGEIIEHLANPGRFLETAHAVLKPEGRLVITTTNAFCLRRFLRIPFGVESVHPDHVYYFSHVTLAGLARRFGYALEAAYGYRLPNRKPFAPWLVERLATAVTPNWGEGIVHVYRQAAGAAEHS